MTGSCVYCCSERSCLTCICIPHDRTQDLYEKYFVIHASTPERLANNSSVDYKAHTLVDLDGAALRGLPRPGTIELFSFCLAPAEYTIQAIDTAGDGWWGGAYYSVVVNGATVIHEEMTASTRQSTTFTVSPSVAPHTSFFENKATHGGGGALFWADEPPKNAERYRNDSTSNAASYGDYVATPARELAATGNGRNTTTIGEITDR